MAYNTTTLSNVLVTHNLTIRIYFLFFPGLNDISVYEEDQVDTQPSNPFKQLQKSPQHSLLDVAMEVLQTITCRKGTSE